MAEENKTMEENRRTVMIAMDGSKYAIHAFECKQLEKTCVEKSTDICVVNVWDRLLYTGMCVVNAWVRLLKKMGMCVINVQIPLL